MKFTGVLAWTILFLLASVSDARLFKNAYVQFELPPNWDCQMEGTEWVCSSKNKNDSRESIIILTAKEVGPQDSLQAYETYLKKPKTLVQQSGKALQSQVKSIKQRKINQHPWVDSLHLSSEIPSYYTRYLATVKEKLAILVTLSAHQRHFTKYSNDFFRAVESLKVTANKDLFNTTAPNMARGQMSRPATETLGTAPAPQIQREMDVQNLPNEGEGQSSRTVLLGLGVVLMLIAVYLFFRK